MGRHGGRPAKISKDGTGRRSSFKNVPNYEKSNRLSEPPLGSLAAIQKSLSSVPNSPISSPVPLVHSAEPQRDGAKQFFGHHNTKNVRDFYRVWGNRPSNQGHITTKSVNPSLTGQLEDYT
uniref:Uncharacterized protein n=1 Tax=Ditylenchus dipsaci TaxID=166011 RepID=A0A915E335_9BILA